MDDTVKGFDITSWQVYFGPANLPKESSSGERGNPQGGRAIRHQGPARRARMEAFSGTPEEFEAFVKEQLVVWEKLITAAGVEKQ